MNSSTGFLSQAGSVRRTPHQRHPHPVNRSARDRIKLLGARRVKRACKFFFRAPQGCRYGDDCQFEHAVESRIIVSPSPTARCSSTGSSITRTAAVKNSSNNSCNGNNHSSTSPVSRCTASVDPAIIAIIDIKFDDQKDKEEPEDTIDGQPPPSYSEAMRCLLTNLRAEAPIFTPHSNSAPGLCPFQFLSSLS